VKRIGILALIAITITTLGCGGPAVGKLQTITLSSTSPNSTGFYNLYGEGGTLQLLVTANYSTTATKNFTNEATFTVTENGTDVNGGGLAAPPQTMTISSTGLVTAVSPFICTWIDETPSATTPSWFLSGSYEVTATYQGITSQPIYIAIASAAGNGPGAECGPQPTN
jgi:hypothetical protein